MDINGIQQSPTSTTLNSVCSMEINAIQQPPTSTILISASSGNVFNGTPTYVASSSSMHNRHPLILSFTSGGSEQWMRRVYALSCGFEPRLYTTKKLRGGEIYKKSVVCNRRGFRESRNMENKSNTRSVKITRVDCLAMIRFRYNGKGYVVDMFHNFHNHILCSVKDAHLQKLTRKLNAFHKQTIINNSKVNIGASTSFRLCKEYANGYENVGASLTEFKNFNRDVKCFIGGKDAQMVIDRFKEISETSKGFYFAYYTDESQILSRIFWCDSQSRQNYSLFGDAVSFDATYGTNKYNMMFAPFTGVDHHKKSVIFGATFLEHKDEESFKCRLEKIFDAMNQKEPQFVWDITLTVYEFESKWAEVIKEFNLEDNSWLCSIYSDRAQWIPAYFTDLPMGCILRTTQRSESENSFLKRFEKKFGTLVEFLLRFQSAMDQQSYAQTCLDKASDHSLPKLESPLGIEKHASTVYTHAVFKEFQGEVETTICSCGVVGVTHDIDHEYSKVGDGISGKIFRVVYSILTKDASCSCKLFERKGLLCCHIVSVLKGKQITKIPEKYILKRWTKNSYRTTFADAHDTVDENIDATQYHKLAVSNVWSEFYSIIPVLKSLSEGQVKELSCPLKSFREKFYPQDNDSSEEKDNDEEDEEEDEEEGDEGEDE
ncbi:protein FAR1-RELATED SEQUENCE 5-like [Silene latifolia]|uniref:protein FAR1-RELATED SEQUENCE 5-like n=1 Tax=Silene latifolia TaxID=37657 RepID=UPI003D776AB2